jgi:hypothetical protein
MCGSDDHVGNALCRHLIILSSLMVGAAGYYFLLHDVAVAPERPGLRGKLFFEIRTAGRSASRVGMDEKGQKRVAMLGKFFGHENEGFGHAWITDAVFRDLRQDV